MNLLIVFVQFVAGDWPAGFRGLAALPEQKRKYVESLKTAVQYAKTLDVQKVRDWHVSELVTFSVTFINLLIFDLLAY